jgi:N12 class adenine-specific DNA methylase
MQRTRVGMAMSAPAAARPSVAATERRAAENAQVNAELAAERGKDAGYKAPKDMAAALLAAGARPTSTTKETSWTLKTNDTGSGEVQIEFNPETGRATVKAEYMGKVLDERGVGGAAALKEAVQRARDGIEEGRVRMAAQVAATRVENEPAKVAADPGKAFATAMRGLGMEMQNPREWVLEVAPGHEVHAEFADQGKDAGAKSSHIVRAYRLENGKEAHRLSGVAEKAGEFVGEMIEDARKASKALPAADRTQVIDNGETNPGEFIVRGDGHNLARFELGKNGRPVRVKHFFESSQTRGRADEAIEKFVAARAPAPAPAPAPAKAKPTVSANTIVTDDAAERARAVLRDKLKLKGGPGKKQAGSAPILDPEVMQAGITMAAYHIERGARTFVAYAKAMVEDLGDEIAPYLKSWYMAAKYDPRAASYSGEMSSAAFVEEFDVAAIAAPSDTEQVEAEPETDDTGHTHHAKPVPPAPVPAPGQGGTVQDAAPGDGNRQPVDDGVAGQGDQPAAGGQVRGGAADAGGSRANGVRQPRKRAPRPARDSRALWDEPGTSGSVDPATAPVSDKPAVDFDLAGEDIGKGGAAAKYRDNIAAIKILKAMEAEGRPATPEERRAIARYVGWGALKGVFDPANKQWAAQHTELKGLLTDAEWKAARASVLNAHYTSKDVVGSMFDGLARLGFTEGRVLEPSVGVGNFFGMMPADLRKKSQLWGVELDPLTAKIAAALYPSAKIRNQGFEEFSVPAEFFDLAIGNPPFGSEPLVDMDRSAYSGFSIHNYFFAKSIDKLRPGGLMAMVVSHNFLDAQTDAARKWIAERADLIAAVRLPRTAFKENAGTEVVTDIVFLQKKMPGESQKVGAFPGNWVGVAAQTNTDPKTGERHEHRVNQYFLDNPSNILGTPSAAGTMYRAGEYTVEPSGDLGEQLRAWVQTLPEGIFQPIDRTRDMEAADAVIPEGIKVGSFFVDEKGAVRQRGEDRLGSRTSLEWVAPNGKAEERMRGQIQIRDALRDQMRMERSSDATEAQIEAGRAKLNELYDAFQKKYGFLNDPTNRRVFLDDTDAPLVQMLEFNYDRGVSKAVAEREDIPERPPRADKADIFTRRVAFPPNENLVVTSAKDALLASMNMRGGVDLPYMARVYDKPEADILAELGELVFTDPVAGVVTADEYLSGDVKTKLTEAKAAAKDNPAYRRNVEALEKVIPKDKQPSEIHASLGAMFIPDDIYTAFMEHVSGRRNVPFHHIKATGQWVGDISRGEPDRVKEVSTWGSARMTATQIMVNTMLGQSVVVKDTHRNSDGSTTTTINEKETEAARSKQQAMKEEWQRWLWADGDRADRVAAIYNEKMNRWVDRTYDGSHLTFPGMNPAIQLLEHQKNGVWRALQSRQILLDHVVGAGKTFQIAAAYMEMRRLGIARKPFLAVPNHLTLQWRDEFARLYPGSKVLAATPDDFAKGSREKFFSKIVTGDWDAVIVGHSSLKKIGLPAETEKGVLEEQITEISDAIEEMKRARGDRNILRDMEGIKKRIEARMKSRIAALGERDKVLTFDELGLDALGVDELHEFKNLFYNSTMERHAGMGNPTGSDKSFDLFVKVRWLFDTFGKKAPLITATGTPVSNSLVEMFNMQRFMQFPTLKEEGLHVFDSWAQQFGNVESVYEVAPSGTGYRTATRFAKYKNLPALMSHYRAFADTVTLEDLKAQEEAQGKRFPVPKMATGRPINVVAQRSPQVAEFMGIPHLSVSETGAVEFEADIQRFKPSFKKTDTGVELSLVDDEGKEQRRIGFFKTEEDARLKLVESALTPRIMVDPNSILGKFKNLRQLTKETKGKVNALSLTGAANKAGLDYRLIDPTAPDFEGSKINQAVGNMIDLWKKTTADKGAQIVFCDLSIPLSSRDTFGTKARRLYVRDDDGAVVAKRGTMHAVEGHEDLPYFVVQRGTGDKKAFDVYDAASGALARGGMGSKEEAKAFALAALSEERTRENWIRKRESAGEIAQEEIDEFNDANEVDTEETEHISRSDIAGMSGSSKFSVYDDIRAKLIRGGVPEREIAFIHDYGTPTAKAKLFARVKAGDVRFLLGSTPKLGAGTNVQNKLVGLHHIDAPWRPSDLEQREGRIVRRGNEFYERDPEGFEVFIWRYATEQTYDTRRWQILEHKSRVIEQLRNYDGTTSEIEDVDGEAASAADMKAAASGDPLILEETRLRNEVKRLENLQAAHVDATATARRAARSWRDFATTRGPAQIREYEQLLATVNANPVPEEGIAPMSVNGTKPADKEALTKAMQTAIARVVSGMGDSAIVYRGLQFRLEPEHDRIALRDPQGHTMERYGKAEAISPSGMVQRMANYAGRIPAHIADVKAEIEKAKTTAAGMDEAATKPFTQADDLAKAREDHRKVQRQLIAKGPDVPADEKPLLRRALSDQRARLEAAGFGDALKEFAGTQEDPAFRQDGMRVALPADAKRVGELQAAADTIGKAFGRKVDIVVLPEIATQATPKAIRDEARKVIANGGAIPSAVWWEGRVYAFADRIESEADLAENIFHEVRGHMGLRGNFGPELDGILRQLAAARPADIQAMIRKNGFKDTERLRAAEEVLAEMAQKNPTIGFVRRAVAALRTWLRQNLSGIFGKLELSDDEIIRSWLLPARAWVDQGARADRSTADVGVRFSQPRGFTSREIQVDGKWRAIEDAKGRLLGAGFPEQSNFWKWAGDTKVVDDKGRPLVVYHGTSQDFAAFDRLWTVKELGRKIGPDSIGSWFSTNPGQDGGAGMYGDTVMPVYLSIKKPIEWTYAELMEALDDKLPKGAKQKAGPTEVEALREELAYYGYDGIKIVHDPKAANGSTEFEKQDAWIALSPEQIKSATGNDGSYSPDTADIRFNQSVNDPRGFLPFGMDVVKEFTATPGKLNWWHKTVGTQFNLAEKNAKYKRVFDSVQTHLADISHYATEAANLAPRILPKLEHWKDLLPGWAGGKKHPLSAEDKAAIQRPVWEGTLVWSRDQDGRPVKLADLEERYATMSVHDKAKMLLSRGVVTEDQLKRWEASKIDVYDGAVNNRFDREFLTAGIRWKKSELQELFGLNERQVGLYNEVRGALDKSLTRLAVADMVRFGGKDLKPIADTMMELDSVIEAGDTARDYLLSLAEADPDREKVLRDSADKMVGKSAAAQRLMDKGYAPLMRFGHYTVDVVDAEGNRVWFSLHESRMDARQRAEWAAKEFPGATVRRGTTSEESYKQFAGISPETLELFGEMLGLEGDGDGKAHAAFQTFLKTAKSNRSAMRRLIERKGIAGFNEDIGRVLAGFVYSNARQTSGNLHMLEMSESVADIDAATDGGELKDAAYRLLAYVKDPAEEAPAFRNLLFAQYLGGSIAAALVNMTQPVQVTMPYLSQWGGVRSAAKVMSGALKDAWKGSTGDAELDAALKRAEEDGVVAPQEVHYLQAQARGADALRAGDGTLRGNTVAALSNTGSRLVLGWGKMFATAELFNRRVAYVAAFRLAKEQGMKNPDLFARRAVDQTQFIYNKGNRPQWARGAIGGTLFTFKQYSISYMELMHRMYVHGGPEGKKAALFALAMLLLMGGAGGLPFAEDAADVAEGVAQRFGYNLNVKQARRQLLNDVFGEGLGGFLEKGVSGLPGAPIDVSGRLGMGNLVPGTGLFQKKEDHSRDILEVAGPAGDFVGRVFQGANQIAAGEVVKGGLTMSPTAARNLAKAGDMATTGMYRDDRGRKVIDTDGYDALVKAIGFQPRDVATTQEATRIVQQRVAAARLREKEIADEWARRVFDKDSAAAQWARGQVSDWNEKNPDSPIRIQYAQILKRVREMNKTKAQRLEAASPKEMRETVRRELTGKP